ncbi:MAG: chromosomal replication initiator protein DnaA [Patescibacteria group bacterium]
MNLEQVWQNALAEIELQISRPNFVTWFTHSQLIEKEAGVALVALPNHFSKEWIENRYYNVILGALRNHDDSTKKIEFIVASHNDSAIKKSLAAKKEKKEDSAGQLSFTEFKIDPDTNLNPRYTFETFVVGKSNELAHAAAQAVITEVGSKYNPLFVYGGVGLGKTHLMQAVGNEIKRVYSNKYKVKYVSSEKFTNDVIWAIRNKRMETIKEKYRLVDVLIIDDIQFIAGKPATEEEFFYTFNALYEQNKQIVISSDRPPKFIPTLEDRLSSRFQGGMQVDISFPDYELRSAIVRTKLQEKAVLLGDEVINTIAEKIQKNIRELEGILNKIIFYQSRGEEITPKFAEKIINESIQEPTKNINPNQILKAVADFYEISPNDLINRSRKKEIAESRQIAMYLLREVLSLSYPFIGNKLGKRDHTTAIYAYEKIAQEMQKNQNLNQKILTIKEMINRE